MPAQPPVAAYDRGRVNLHGYASATPTTDGEAVYAFFGRSGVVAFSLSGDLLWRTSVGDGIHSSWGSAASPILHNNLVIINACIESQSIVALDKQTGQVVWETPGIERSWSTPLIVEVPDGSQELVVSMKSAILGLDPKTGKQLWRSSGVDDYTCPAVIAQDGIVYVTAGRSPQFFAVRAGGRGDVTDTHILWETAATPKVATPVYHQGRLYWVDQKGIACCADADTGKVIYRERLNLKGAGDTVYASLVAADGKLYGVSREDGAFVLAAAAEFRLLARNFLDDSSIFNATPTISNGQLLLRSDRYLYCLGD
jgi:outer membrane protein assembly factor BamB